RAVGAEPGRPRRTARLPPACLGARASEIHAIQGPGEAEHRESPTCGPRGRVPCAPRLGQPGCAAQSQAQAIESRTVPAPTVAPATAVSPTTVPSLWAAIGCSIFIASRTRTVSPLTTSWPSTTVTLTIVACIGALMLSPVAVSTAPARRRFGGAARLADWLAPPTSLAGRETSTRLPS